MRFTCKKCHTTWESDDSVSQGLVQCPNCFVVLPLSVAQASAAPPSTAHPSKTVHELPTVIESPPGDVATAAPTTSDSPTVVTPEPRRLVSREPEQSAPTRSRERENSAIGHETLANPRSPGREPISPTVTEATFLTSDATEPAATELGESSKKVVNTAAREQPPGSSQPAKTHGADLSGVELGGFEIRATLGRGGMGTVYLARQKSLDRYVALKVLPAEMAQQPEFLARFTREALAAAQLTHHNVVQIYDVGSDNDTHFIAMEYVRGTNLGEMVRRDGRLNVDDAVGYIIQAARALKYAHDRGIIHRDVKPDNLLLNDQGIVKLADLGLAKFEHARVAKEESRLQSDERVLKAISVEDDLTLKAVAMGTPAYMAPEQARDAAHVDARADQYALGCTLYYLITGKPPFSGTTAFEIITKQLNEPVPPLDTHVRGVPPTLKVIIERMLAKNPDDRYGDMGEVIRDLEAYLGVETEKGVYRPREIHLAILEEAQRQYYGIPLRRVQRLAPRIFMGGMLALVLASVTLGAPRLGLFLLLTLILTPVFLIALDGILQKSYFVRRIRSAAFGMALIDWLKILALVALGTAATFQLGLVGLTTASIVTSLALAVGYEFAVLRRLREGRSPVLHKLEQMLKELRLRGMPEEALQEFVARFAGEEWEELFEDLFGYEALVIARGKVAPSERVKKRRAYAPWRDPILRWLDDIERRRREAREVKQLVKVEAKRLAAQGASEEEALRKAQEAATVILTEIKATVGAPRPTVYADPFALRKKSSWLRLGFVSTVYRILRAFAGLAILAVFLAQ
ncbi:MAG: protein kinase, partial [Candidatus Sumerlaeaceae bacterium]|nr:protein kinase [Candidatus Sumerlaeaceae bacterium]